MLTRILRSPDPLDTDCSNIDTDFPLLKGDKVYRLEIRHAEVIPGKEEGMKNLHFQACTTQEAVSTKGDPIHPGYPIQVYIGITRTEKRSDTDIAKRIAEIVKATGKTGLNPRMVIDNPSVLEGLVADAKVKVSPAKDGYKESNSIGTWIPATK